MRNVFSNRNILTISLTSTLWSVSTQAWQPYWALYLKEELGATVAIVGLLSMIQNAQMLLFQLPGGILTDKIGRRKVILYGTCIRFIAPVVYLLATSWEQVLVAVIADASANVYNPALDAIVADSLPRGQRGAGYGAYRMINSLPMVFMPTVGGIVMDSLGYKAGVKIFNVATFLIIAVILVVRMKLITETLAKKGQQRSARATFSSALKVPRTIWVMMVVATLGGFAMRMVMQFISIYAREVILLSNTELGLGQTVGMLLSSILIMPTGMLSDRIGRKPIITVAQIIQPLATWGIILVGIGSFPQYVLLRLFGGIGSALGGGYYGFAGGPAWQALVMDLVPNENRGTILGLMSTVTGAVASPSSLIGGYLYEGSPQTPFNIALIIGLISVPIFVLFVKEPKKGGEQ
jgi:MFS family permease